MMQANLDNIVYIYNQSPNDPFWYSFFSEQIITLRSDKNIINLLFISSLLSLIIGTVLGLAQSQIKRLLAYSKLWA